MSKPKNDKKKVRKPTRKDEGGQPKSREELDREWHRLMSESRRDILADIAAGGGVGVRG